MDNFKQLNETDLKRIDGGIAPIFIGLGIVCGLGGGFAGGYWLANKFG